MRNFADSVTEENKSLRLKGTFTVHFLVLECLLVYVVRFL